MRKTIKERRIEILKDVLKQLKLERYIAKKGSYVLLPRELSDKMDTHPNNSAQKELLACTKSCRICAKGGIFLSAVRKENKVKIKDLDWDNYDENNKASQRVIKLFGKSNLDRIEAAFERWLYKSNYIGYEASRKISYSGEKLNVLDIELKNFVKQYPNKKERLVAIIKNCIKNGGIFTLK